MSERFPGENLEIARQMFIWWNLGDHAVMEEAVLDPQIEIHTPLSSTKGTPYRGRESGIELDQPMGWLLTFRDGMLARYEVFADHDAARRAAGIA